MNDQKLSQTAILYISGAGLSSAIWDPVRAKLNLPSAVLTHAHTNTATLDSVVQEALDQAQALGAGRYVIVAHSLGGVIGVELARQLGDQLAGFVAVSATIPAPGESFVDTMPFPQKLILPLILKLAGTKPPVSAIRKGLCSDLDDTQAAAVITSFAPEPRHLYTDKTSGTNLPATHALYVRTTEDKQLPLQLQSRLAQRLEGVTLVDVASGHLPMLSHSDELAGILADYLNNL